MLFWRIEAIARDGVNMDTPLKLIFLDIDGVMNTTSSALRHRTGTVFAPEPVIALRWLLAKTGARIVISSTRRRSGLKAMRELFANNQLTDYSHRIISLTPILVATDTDEWREDEIQLWLDGNSRGAVRILILDDKPLTGPLAKRLMCTDANHGLTLEMAHQAAGKITH